MDVDGNWISGEYIEVGEQGGDGKNPYTHFTAIDVKAGPNDFTIPGETVTPAK